MTKPPASLASAAWSCVIALLLGGCVAYPTASDYQEATAPYPGGALPSGLDGRADFRETFCAVMARTAGAGASRCGSFLWRLADEPAAAEPPTPAPNWTSRHRVFIVTGAFGDCRLPGLVPFEEALPALAAAGVVAQVVTVSGRSGTSHNARQLADALRGAALMPNERIVLVGYSKGAVDILQFLVDEPELAARVAAVISVSGPIMGTPLADMTAGFYHAFLSGGFSSLCDPGDGGLVDSLRPEVRRDWFATHRLPSHVRYFSIASFTTRDHMSRALREPWQALAHTSRFNDGQVLPIDAVIPGSTLLGYVNADHWDAAIAAERAMPRLASRPDPRVFPRAALLEALLMYVDAELASDETAGERSHTQKP